MDVVQLINSVYHRRAIWDQSHPDHRNRYVLDKLWEEVANECNNQSVKKVSEKWKNLRDYFRKELKKIPLPRSGDPGEEALKKSSWPHFKSLLFLRDQFLPRSSHSNLLDPDNDTQVSTPSTQMDENDGDYDEDEMDETQGVETQETEPDHTESVTPIQSTPKEPRTILKNRARKRSNQLDAFLEIEKKKLQYLDEKRVAADRGRALPVTDDDKLFFDSLLPHVVKIRPHRKLQFRNEIQNLVQKYAYEEYSNNQSTINVSHSVNHSPTYTSQPQTSFAHSSHLLQGFNYADQ
ncbi:unnamed protein product [Acanthoscelides obtectus]|uniref:MADF domain-containing protein n=1 Tax=Acanthoscelides obtectus TaxID=200917 RepID=A0A9P0M7M9_ACAOB|nr:unnamed protein product [Acanthoscelides obtectus]CAH2010679.1 unnamed protein product [Acanthoscelides obtectus]CAK1660623.1 hypothetical protein AOBTE_LOCUS22187 [Acanthoscelides obtectus]CAK1669914.1 hypothetical protein AOBTE_LOCUS27303 [Acanthoscelides obtectus]